MSRLLLLGPLVLSVAGRFGADGSVGRAVGRAVGSVGRVGGADFAEGRSVDAGSFEISSGGLAGSVVGGFAEAAARARRRGELVVQTRLYEACRVKENEETEQNCRALRRLK